jgi:hypothetical protein
MKTNFTFFANLRKKTFLIIVFVIFFNLHNHAQYCAATGGNCDDYINQVQFSNIDIWSWCESYRDFSNFQADVVLGVTYPINVRNNNHYLTDTCDVWIDWDQDGIFNDSTEYYRLLNDINPYHADIFVPVNATVGQTKMRIRIRREGIQTPCGDASQLFGEVEDYTVNVMSPVSMVMNYYNFIHKSGYTTAGRTEQTISGININTTGNVDNLYLKNLFFNTFNSNGNLDSYYIYYTGNNPDPDSYNNWFGNMSNYNGYQMQFTDSFRLQDGDNYFWLKYDISSTPNLGDQLKAVADSFQINDTTYVTNLTEPTDYIEITTALNGDYRINQQGNGDYLSFNEAVADLIKRGISGPVVFNVDTGNYYEQIVIPSIYGASSYNTITFQSSDSSYASVLLEHISGGGSSPVIGNAASATGGIFTINLSNASYITFKNLSISSGLSSNYSRVVLFENNCDNVQFIGNHIYGSQTSNSGDNYSLMYFANYSQFNYLLIDHNIFENGGAGINSQSWYSIYNLLITNNTFLQQNLLGLNISNAESPIVSNNIFHSDIYSWTYEGITFNSIHGNIQLNKNRFTAANKDYFYGIHFYYNYNYDTNSLISNNFIAVQSVYANSAIGLKLDNSGFLKIFYNSINIVGNNNNSSCVDISNSNNLSLRNNNFSNTASGYVLMADNSQGFNSDYNNLYYNSQIASLNWNDVYDLASWISITQSDSNSISILPEFISDTNLHSSNMALGGKGIPLAEVTDDIDNEARNLIAPDLGADEFIIPLADLQVEGFVNLPNGCGLSNNESITVIIKNNGINLYNADSATINFTLDISQQLVTSSIDRDIAFGDTIHFTFPIGADLSVNSYQTDTTFGIKCWIDFTNDLNHNNDSANSTVISKYTPPTPIVTDTSINYGTTATLITDITQYNPLWYDELTGGNLLQNGNPYITAILYNTDTFYVSNKDGGTDYITLGQANGSSGYPFFTYYHDCKTQMLYTAQELNALGIHAGFVSSLAFNVSTIASQTMDGFTIEMQNTSLASLSGFTHTGWTNVYSGFYTVADYGWQEIVFQNPFLWDGSSNILINLCFDNTFYTSNSEVYSTYDPGKVWMEIADGSTGCAFSSGYTQDYRPDIKLKVTIGNGCESNRIPLIVNVGSLPTNDLGVVSINTPVDGFEISGSSIVDVTIKNFGGVAIDTFYVSYQKDNNTLVSELVIQTINPGSSINYSFLQTVDISALGTHNFIAFTSLTGDSIYINDTSYKTIQNTTYCQATYSNGCYYSNINSIILNTLSNTNSGCNSNTGSYIIYPESSFTTSLKKGVSYPFTITPGNYSYYNGYAIWIDLNHDGDFDDIDECVYYSYNTQNTLLNNSIFVSTNHTYLGITRMRVRALRNNNILYNQSCTYFNEYGETEDYFITILPPPLQKDLELVSVIKPDNSAYKLVPADFIISVKNIGLDVITQIPFKYIFNSDSIASYTWNGIIQPQQQLEIPIGQLTANSDSNNIMVYSEMPGDLNNLNDTIFKFYTVLPAPALISIAPDTIFGTLASCDSSASQTYTLSITNQGYQPLIYNILQKGSISENFENGLNKWIYNGNWGLINQGYNSGYALTESPSGNYGNNWNQYIQLKDSVLVSNKDSCKISYWLKRNMESCCDYLNTQISVNNGGWISLSPSFNGTEGWSLKQFSFSSYVDNGDFIKFRFTFTADYSYTGDGVLIDDFSIKGISNNTWLSLNKNTDTVAVGNSSVVNITMTVGQLNAGTYNQTLTILSNDPLSTFNYFPVYLTLAGYPQISVKDSIRAFPSIMAGADATEYLKIYNTGCDSLKILSIVNQNPAFNISHNSIVLPKDSSTITVHFNSPNQGLQLDTLLLISNAGNRKFYVSGIILPTPILVYNPDSIVVSTSICNDTLNEILVIKNEGNTTMNWEAYYNKGAGKSLSFNGSNSQVQFGNLGVIPNNGTIEFWMKSPVSSGNNKLIFSTSGNNSNWKGINIFQNGTYLYLLIGDNAGNYYGTYQIASNISNNQWHHVAVAWDKTLNYGIYTYFDGNLIQNGSYNTYWPSLINDVRLGTGYYNSSSYFYYGEIDELRIWSEKRSLSDIRANMFESIIIPKPSLIGLWGFNETSGNIAYNFKDNIYNGNLINISKVNSGANIINSGFDLFPTNGVLAAGDSINVDVTINTNGFNSGIFHSLIQLKTNDPLNKNTLIPTYLQISGNAKFELQSNNLQIDSIMAGAIITDSVFIKNTGCDTLKIQNISNTNSAFTHSQTILNILPRDSAKFYLTFNPINIGTYYDTLIFSTNAGIHNLYVMAIGIAAPIASVNPVSINDTITICNQSKIKYLKMRNTGNEILSWNVVMGGTGISDNFDNGITGSNWSEISGGIAAASCGTALNSTNALYFNGNLTRQAVTKTINTIGGGSVSYYIKIANGSSPCEAADYGEDIVFEYSANNGSSWNIIQTLNTGNYTVFTNIQVSIPSAAQNFNTKFRWRQLSHSGSCCDHWAIDEVSINILNTANISPVSGNVAIGDSATIQVVLNGQGLINGLYNSQLLFNTNDPVHSQITVPIQMRISGSPAMLISNNQLLVMDTIMMGASSTKPLYIKNTGCDTLRISNITKSLSEFSLNKTSLNIAPKDSAFVNVTFTTNNIATYSDNLIIISNAGNLNVILKGKSVGAPQIITLPDLITTNFTCDSQIITPFKIKNPGVVLLNWNAYIEKLENGALQFDGINDYVNINSSFLSNSNWTVEAWVKPTDLSLGNKLIAGSIRSCTPWGLYMVDGKFAVIYQTSLSSCDQTLIADNVILTPNTWYHVACTYNGTKVRLYINGLLVKSTLENSLYNTNSSAFIGGDPSYGRYFSGSIDEVRIWNRARSQSQISFSKNYMLKGNETGLKAYWSFNKINGNAYTDYSASNINAIVNNGVLFTQNSSPVIGSIVLNNTSGTIGVGDSTQINLTINRQLLAQGSHPFKLIVISDDPIKPYDTTLITINATFNLTPVDLGADSIICSGNAITLNAGNYATYLWNNNLNSSSISINSTGKYFVNVADANGCKSSDTVQINYTQSPIADAGVDKSICYNNSVTINAIANSGTAPYQYQWYNNANSLVSNYANYSFTPGQSTYYYLKVTDNNGCASLTSDTVKIIVNPNPIANAGADAIVTLGNSVMLNGSASGGTFPYTVLWNYANTLSSSNILTPLASPTLSTHYTLNIADANGCTASDYAYVEVRYSLSGTVTYYNSALTPMPNTKVYLLNSNNEMIDSVLTNGLGKFSFFDVRNDYHTIFAMPNNSFGGVNSTDALGVRRHIVSIAALSGIKLLAADVNASTTVSSADALLILRRTVGLISEFTTGNWVSQRVFVLVGDNTQNQNINVLCTGDINGSHDPFGTKSTDLLPDLICKSNEKHLIPGQEFDIPIMYNNIHKPGAVTLHLKYPENLIEIIGVQSDGNILEYQVTNGIISIGFYNENGINLKDKVLLSLKCRIKLNAIPSTLSIAVAEQSEIADISGNTLTGIILEAPCYQICDLKSEFAIDDIYPNPFSTLSKIRLYAPENARVQLNILNLLGENIKTIDVQKISVGWNDIFIDAADLSEGVYMYRLQAIGQNKKLDQSNRMVIIR